MKRLLQIEKRERKKNRPGQNQSGVKTEGKFRALSQRGGGEEKKKRSC